MCCPIIPRTLTACCPVAAPKVLVAAHGCMGGLK